jgi:membrane-bound ClpP family serine protease
VSIPVIIFLILLSIFLFVVEFLLIPGITVAGIGGALLLIAALFMGYKYHGVTTGNLLLAGTFVLFVATTVVILKGRTWKRISLHTTIDSRVNMQEEGVAAVKTGDTGKTVSRLNPMGKVMIAGRVYEAKSITGYVEQQEEIEVVKVSGKQIIVKPKSKQI